MSLLPFMEKLNQKYWKFQHHYAAEFDEDSAYEAYCDEINKESRKLTPEQRIQVLKGYLVYLDTEIEDNLTEGDTVGSIRNIIVRDTLKMLLGGDNGPNLP